MHGYGEHPDYAQVKDRHDDYLCEWRVEKGYPWAENQVYEQLTVEMLLADVRRLLDE
jgi:hypothetical protein